MIDTIKLIKQKYDSNDLEEGVEGIELSTNLIEEVGNLALNFFENNANGLYIFSITEKISMFFSGYISRLQKYLESENPELRFWSASLLVYYNINNMKAQKFLLDEVINGSMDKMNTAVILLARHRNIKLIDAIKERLKQKHLLEDKFISFLEQKLEDCANGG